VSLIGKFTGKVIDIIVKSSVCKMCERWARKEQISSTRYGMTSISHIAPRIIKVVGKMEVDGVLEMF